MSQDFTKDLIWAELEEYAKKQIDSGLSNDEIQAIIEAIGTGKIATTVIEQISNDCISSIYRNMYERVMIERNKTAKFIIHNEQLWQSGFVTSEMMYLIVVESAEAYCKIFDELTDDQKRERQYRYTVLRELHGRACQEFLEILCLLKSGFADGAYARWRSMYELSIVSQFIWQNDETVAKAYYEESFADGKEYEWAKVAPCFVGKKSVTFRMIQQQCDMATDQWQKQYRLSCKVLHAAPQGTFARLGSPANVKVVAIGHSDYGIATPAINSAITLAIISSLFFNFLSSGDGTVYSYVTTKWLEKVRERYSEIEKSCFNGNDATTY